MNKLFKPLLIGQACIWLVFGLITYIKNPSSLVMPILMLIGALGFIFILFTFRINTFFKILGLAYIVLNLILTFTDQFGLFDTIILAINILTIISMINILKGDNNAELKE